MGAIVKELKEKIVAAGGDTTGIQTVSEALDKLPSGGGSSGAGGLRLYPTYDSEQDGKLRGQAVAGTTRLDKTAKEIADAFDDHGNVYWIHEFSDDDMMGYEKIIIGDYTTNGIVYEFTALEANYSSDPMTFTADTPTSYPARSNR